MLKRIFFKIYNKIKRRKFQANVTINPEKKLVSDLRSELAEFCFLVNTQKSINSFDVEINSLKLRKIIRSAAGLPFISSNKNHTNDNLTEFGFIFACSDLLRPAFNSLACQRVLYCGQAYYNAFYLSRALRPLGWKADLYNWDTKYDEKLHVKPIFDAKERYQEWIQLCKN